MPTAGNARQLDRYYEILNQSNAASKGVDLLESFKEQKPSAVRKVLYRMMEAHVAEYEKDKEFLEGMMKTLKWEE